MDETQDDTTANVEVGGGDIPPQRLPSSTDAKTDLVYGNRFILGCQSRSAEEGFYYVAPRGRRSASNASQYPLNEGGWVSAWKDFAAHEPSVAANYVRVRAQSAQVAAKAAAGPPPPVPLVTVSTLPGREVVELLGLVAVWSVISRNMFSDFGSDVSSLVGGSLGGVETAIGRAVDGTREKIYAEAQRLGADAIIGVKLDLQTVSDKAQAILLTGTAVRSQLTPTAD